MTTDLTVPVLLKAMAERIRQVPGVADAFYPAKNQLQNLPAVPLYWSGPANTRITHDPNGQMWIVSAKAQVLVARRGNDTPDEFARVDNLITPIVDAFAIDPDGNAPVIPLPRDIDGNLSRVAITEIRSSLMVEYAKSVYYAAELYFDIKFHRYARLQWQGREVNP